MCQMKQFEKHQLREALSYAMDGGQALHVYTSDSGFLYDQDKFRLKHLARRLGVHNPIKIEGGGRRNQHVELSGRSFARACTEVDALLRKIKYIEALPIAKSLVLQLKLACDRIEISGELRRLEEDIHKIDILARLSIYGTSGLDLSLQKMRKDGVLRSIKSGTHTRQLSLPGCEIGVQMYLVEGSATWGVRSVNLTGPVDFSHWMVSRRSSGGTLPNHLYIKDGVVYDSKTGRNLNTPEEEDFFEICGWPWIRPENRIARWTK